MITTGTTSATVPTDLDCNHVSLSASDPDITVRCAMREGHVGGHYIRIEVMRHQHRKSVATDTDAFRRPLGGRHRADIPAPVRAVTELFRGLDKAMGVSR